MNDDRIAEIRARHEVDAKIATVLNPELPPTWTLAGWRAHDDRATLLAEVERQARHIEELREKIDAERSCACSFDAPGDVCAAHSPALTRARAEVERLTEWQSINHSEQHKLGWSMTEFCEGKRDHLHEMWERPPSLDYGIAHIEAEIKRLRAENARLRAQIAEYFAEPATHPVEREE